MEQYIKIYGVDYNIILNVRNITTIYTNAEEYLITFVGVRGNNYHKEWNRTITPIEYVQGKIRNLESFLEEKKDAIFHLK